MIYTPCIYTESLSLWFPNRFDEQDDFAVCDASDTLQSRHDTHAYTDAPNARSPYTADDADGARKNRREGESRIAQVVPES